MDEAAIARIIQSAVKNAAEEFTAAVNTKLDEKLELHLYPINY